jgi:hypothetical protein
VDMECCVLASSWLSVVSDSHVRAYGVRTMLTVLSQELGLLALQRLASGNTENDCEEADQGGRVRSRPQWQH